MDSTGRSNYTRRIEQKPNILGDFCKKEIKTNFIVPAGLTISGRIYNFGRKEGGKKKSFRYCVRPFLDFFILPTRYECADFVEAEATNRPLVGDLFTQ